MDIAAMPVRRFMACRAHFGAPLALLEKAARTLPLLQPATSFVRGWLARYTDNRARLFDVEHGTETFERVQMQALGLNDEFGNHFDNWAYGPICSDFFDEMMRAIPRREELVFFDVGCGKGLPLLLAGRYGFRRVVGIEMSEDLCRIAGHNVERYSERIGKRVDAEIVVGDFMKHDLGAEPTAFFLNNPFPHYIAQLAMEHIEKSVVKHPRRVVVAYRRMPRATLLYLQTSAHLKLEFTTPYWQIFSNG